MKLYVLMLGMLMANAAHGQNKNGVSLINYRFKAGAEHFKQYAIDGEIDKNTQPEMGLAADQNPPKKGYIIRSLYEKGDCVYYAYWDFTDSGLKEKYNDKVFKMPNAIFDSITQRLYSRFKGVRAGTFIIPFRLRGVGGKKFDFEAALNLQENVVIGFGRRTQERSWLDFSAGIGVTGINLDSGNSKAMENRTAAALTISSGAVVKFNQYVNCGVFIGWDFLQKKDREASWIYDQKPWIGVGVNITFNEIKTDKAPNNKNQ